MNRRAESEIDLGRTSTGGGTGKSGMMDERSGRIHGVTAMMMRNHGGVVVTEVARKGVTGIETTTTIAVGMRIGEVEDDAAERGTKVWGLSTRTLFEL